MPNLKDVYEVTDVIKGACNPHAIILFGSLSRGDKGNDIDLLIVTNKRNERKITKSLYPFYQKYPIDTFMITRKKLKELYMKGSPFLRLIQKEGRLVYMKNLLDTWKDSAHEDMRQAKYLLEGDFYKGVCYSSQQSAEKIIKWALLKRGWELEKAHSIRRLIAIAKDHGINLTLRDEDVDFIDSIYKGRYPGEDGLLPLGNPTKRDAKKALQIAQNITEQIETHAES